MSQVSFKQVLNGHEITVLSGWDRPLQYFFLTIWEGENEDDPIYDCLNNPDCFSIKSMDLILARLKIYQITPPDGFRERCERKEGNVIHTWNGSEWESHSW